MLKGRAGVLVGRGGGVGPLLYHYGVCPVNHTIYLRHCRRIQLISTRMFAIVFLTRSRDSVKTTRYGGVLAVVMYPHLDL